MVDHLLIAKESTPGTFVTPSATAHSGLQEFAVTPGEQRFMRRESGRSRDVIKHVRGTHRPSGSLTTLVESDNNLINLLRALGATTLTTSTPGGATSSRDHVLTFDDDAASISLSMQAQQRRIATTSTVNLRGVELSSLTLAVGLDDYLRLTAEFVCYEEQVAGGTFGDGNSSPAAVGSVSYNTVEAAFEFADMTISQGGTVSQDGTTKVYSLSGSTDLADVESLEISIAMNKEQRFALGSRYAQDIIDGNRDVTGSLTVRNDTPSTAFLTKLRAGTQEAYLIKFTGVQIESGFTTEFEIALPLVGYTDTDAYGALSSEHGARTLTIPFTGLLHESTGNAVAFRVRNDTASYS